MLLFTQNNIAFSSCTQNIIMFVIGVYLVKACYRWNENVFVSGSDIFVKYEIRQ